MILGSFFFVQQINMPIAEEYKKNPITKNIFNIAELGYQCVNLLFIDIEHFSITGNFLNFNVNTAFDTEK